MHRVPAALSIACGYRSVSIAAALGQFVDEHGNDFGPMEWDQFLRQVRGAPGMGARLLTNGNPGAKTQCGRDMDAGPPPEEEGAPAPFVGDHVGGYGEAQGGRGRGRAGGRGGRRAAGEERSTGLLLPHALPLVPVNRAQRSAASSIARSSSATGALDPGRGAERLPPAGRDKAGGPGGIQGLCGGETRLGFPAGGLGRRSSFRGAARSLLVPRVLARFPIAWFAVQDKGGWRSLKNRRRFAKKGAPASGRGAKKGPSTGSKRKATGSSSSLPGGWVKKGSSKAGPAAKKPRKK